LLKHLLGFVPQHQPTSFYAPQAAGNMTRRDSLPFVVGILLETFAVFLMLNRER